MGELVNVYTLVGYLGGAIYYYRGYCVDNKPAITFDFFEAAMFYSKASAECANNRIKMKVEEHGYYV